VRWRPQQNVSCRCIELLQLLDVVRSVSLYGYTYIYIHKVSYNMYLFLNNLCIVPYLLSVECLLYINIDMEKPRTVSPSWDDHLVLAHPLSSMTYHDLALKERVICDRCVNLQEATV
jgi:hypothetical protein